MAYFSFNPRDRQSHPFWDFVASMDNDYSDMRRPPSYGPRDGAPEQEGPAAEAAGQQQAQQNEKYQAPSVEDEKMADPEIRGPAKRNLADTEKPGDSKEKENSSGDERCGRRCRRGGPRGMHQHGPPSFGPFGFLPFGPDFGGDFSDWTPPHQHGRHRGGHRGHHHHGPPPPVPGVEQAPPQSGAFGPGPRGCHGRRDRHDGPFGRRGRGRDFNLPAFLSQLGQRLGVDLNSAAANFGVDLNRATANSDADFTPTHDLFDLSDKYLIHVSLPGAHKEDIGLDFDGENHTLRVAGVVYRPGIDETISSALVHAGRNREVGVFETKVRLPARGSDDVEVNINGISAKLREGVLVIQVPKIQKKKEEMRRSIRIGSSSPSPVRDSSHPQDLPIHEKPSHITDVGKGKDNLVIPENELDMYYASPSAHPTTATTPGTEKGDEERSVEGNEKKENERDHEQDAAMHDNDDPPEQLPAYHPHDNDKFSNHGEDDEEEGEYIKIDVN